MTQNQENQALPKLWSASFVYLLSIGILNATSFGMTGPLIPGFAVSLGASLSLAGLATGIFSFAALVGRPFASVIGDSFNKKHALILFMFLNGLMMALYAAVPDFAWFLPARVVHGLLFSVSGTVNFALGAEFVPKQRLAEGVGFLGISMIIGMAIGPNIGIFIMESYSYQVAFIMSGAGIMLASSFLIKLKYESDTPPKEGGFSFRAIRLKDLFAVELLPNVGFTALLSIGSGLAMSYLVMLGYERNIANIGMYFVVHAIVVLFTRPKIGRMTDRKGVAFVVLPGYLIAATAMILIAQATTLPLILLAATLFAIGAGGAFPAFQTDCIKRLDASRRTLAMGTYLIGFDVGMTTGQTMGGVVSDVFGFRVAFMSAGVLMLLGFVIYWFYNRRDGKKVATVAE